MYFYNLDISSILFEVYIVCIFDFWITILVIYSSELQPPSSAVPLIVAELSGSSVFLKCMFADSSGNSSLGYVVTWWRLSPEGTREELRKDTTIETFAFIELDGINLRLGDRVPTLYSVFTFIKIHIY